MPRAAERRLLERAADAIDAAILATRTQRGDSNAFPPGRRIGNGRLQLRYQVHDDCIACDALKQVEESRPWPRPWTCIPKRGQSQIPIQTNIPSGPFFCQYSLWPPFFAFFDPASDDSYRVRETGRMSRRVRIVVALIDPIHLAA